MAGTLLLTAVILGSAAMLWISTASAASPTWTYGPDTTLPAFDCQIYSNTHTLSIDPIGGDGYVGYYGTPTAGQVYYVGVVYEAVTQSIASDGTCLGSQDVSMRLALPPGTAAAVSASAPIVCFDNGVQFSTNCPTNVEAGTGGELKTDPDSGNQVWQVADGTVLEIAIPVVTSSPSASATVTGDPRIWDGFEQTTAQPWQLAVLPTVTYPVAAGSTSSSTSTSSSHSSSTTSTSTSTSTTHSTSTSTSTSSTSTSVTTTSSSTATSTSTSTTHTFTRPSYTITLTLTSITVPCRLLICQPCVLVSCTTATTSSTSTSTSSSSSPVTTSRSSTSVATSSSASSSDDSSSGGSSSSTPSSTSGGSSSSGGATPSGGVSATTVVADAATFRSYRCPAAQTGRRITCSLETLGASANVSLTAFAVPRRARAHRGRPTPVALVKIGAATASNVTAGLHRVTLTLSHAGARLLAARHHLNVTVALAVTAPGRTAGQTASTVVALSAPRAG